MAWLLAPARTFVGPQPLEQLAEWLRGARLAGYDVVALGHLEANGALLDPFALIGALADEPDLPGLAAACDVGDMRHASVMARELTTVDHLLPGRSGLVLLGRSTERLHEAAAVVTALLGGGPVTVAGIFEHVADAPNLPPPRSVGGPPLLSLDVSSEPPRCIGRSPGTAPSEPWRLLVADLSGELPAAPRNDVPTITISHEALAAASTS